VGALQGVVDVVGGGYVGFAAGEGFGDAEEADEVGAVGVKVLSMNSEASAEKSPEISEARRDEAYLAFVR
jgi:hypothetical protein